MPDPSKLSALRHNGAEDASPRLPLVLKLGGSLAESSRMAAVLELVLTASRPIVIVPGGGPFADTIRTLQPTMALTDALAHRLALLAMHQLGLVIASSSPRLVLCETMAEVSAALANTSIPVWLPFALQSNDDTLPADWTATSDALAARLAERLGSVPVALVKSCEIAPDATLANLAEQGITDPVFPVIVTRANLPWAVFGAGDEADLRAELSCASR